MRFGKYLSVCLAFIMVFLSGCNNSSSNNAERSNYKTALIDEKQDLSGVKTEFDLNFLSAEEMLIGMTKISSNDKYELFFCPKSLIVAVKEKSTGKIFSTNPWNADNDPLSVGDNEASLKSQLEITYLGDDNTVKTMCSYKDCLNLGQYKTTLYSNGIRIDYTIGKKSDAVWVLPAMTVKRFEDIASHLDGRDLMKWEMLYNLTSIEEVDEEKKDEIIKKFPLLESEELYISTELNANDERSIDEYLRKCGYTQNDFDKALQEVGAESESEITPVFDLSVEYVLTEKGLSVTIPNESISYDTENFTLLTVGLLKYFGADMPTENDDGYIFMPDGSGALIDINNQSESRREFISGRIYGKDPAFEQTDNDNLNANISMPVFGIKRNSGEGLFAIVTQGEETGNITAILGEPNTSYYSVSCEFVYTESDTVTFSFKKATQGTTSYIIVPAEESTKSDFSIDYSFLTGEDTGYNQMAKIYREYLFGDKKTDKCCSAVLGINTLGTALYDTDFLGIFYKKEALFTPYEQSGKIVTELNESFDAKIGINLFLSGWQKNGLDAGVSNRIKLSSALGGIKEFERLVELCDKSDISLIPDTDMFFVKNNIAFDGFSLNSDAAIRLDKKFAGKGTLDPELGIYDNILPFISPEKYASYFQGYFSDVSELKLKNISLGNVGSVLGSDFDTENVYTRNETKKLIIEALKKYSGTYKIALSGTNAYALTFADYINDIPFSCSGFAGESRSVPFVQLVCSGYVEYYCSPINLNEDTTALLNCISTGTNPYYIVASENTEQLKATKYTKYYSIDYKRIKERILKEAEYYAEAVEICNGAYMVSFEYVTDEVTKTSFSNGSVIYVNIGNEDYIFDDMTVNAKYYVAKAG